VKIFFSPEAEEDFAGAIGYLAARSPQAAEELGRRVFVVVDRLSRRELEGPEHLLETGELVSQLAGATAARVLPAA